MNNILNIFTVQFKSNHSLTNNRGFIMNDLIEKLNQEQPGTGLKTNS